MGRQERERKSDEFYARKQQGENVAKTTTDFTEVRYTTEPKRDRNRENLPSGLDWTSRDGSEGERGAPTPRRTYTINAWFQLFINSQDSHT